MLKETFGFQKMTGQYERMLFYVKGNPLISEEPPPARAEWSFESMKGCAGSAGATGRSPSFQWGIPERHHICHLSLPRQSTARTSCSTTAGRSR